MAYNFKIKNNSVEVVTFGSISINPSAIYELTTSDILGSTGVITNFDQYNTLAQLCLNGGISIIEDGIELSTQKSCDALSMYYDNPEHIITKISDSRIRVCDTNIQYNNGSTTYDIWHSGNVTPVNTTTSTPQVLSSNISVGGASGSSGASLTTPTGSAVCAPINIGSYGVTKTTPVDGDIWKSSTDVCKIQMGANTRTFCFLESSPIFVSRVVFQTVTSTSTGEPINIGSGTTTTSPSTLNAGAMFINATDGLNFVKVAGTKLTVIDNASAQSVGGIKTFTATPVISSTTTATTAGAIYKRTNYGHVGYEAGHAQEFLSNIYIAPVGTALTNSTTETDVNGGTAIFGTRTLSATLLQIGVNISIRCRVSFTNTASNTLTLRLRWSTISGTQLASATITRVNTSAEPFDIVFRGVASATPSASASTSWTCDVIGNSLISSAATCSGSIVSLATSTATPLIVSAQWSSALATSSTQTLTSVINID